MDADAPATTPASQMGILHGTIEGIPAFRWVDRATGRVFVANRRQDAADIEAAHSDGRGLLADGGVSVSNLFTGDAPVAFATMSAVGSAARSPEGRRAFTRFVARPEGLARGLSRTVSEVVRERFQARRQVRQDMRPRVHRGWDFAGERSALNGVLRDFNTITVAEAMLRGARSVYVDYVDYDAVAHHAGISRPESLEALLGLDRVLGQLEEVAELAPRPYRIVVLSDHGQSQGEVFADRYGEDLATLVARLARTGVAASTVNTEGPPGLGRSRPGRTPGASSAVRCARVRPKRPMRRSGRTSPCRRLPRAAPATAGRRCSSSDPAISASSTWRVSTSASASRISNGGSRTWFVASSSTRASASSSCRTTDPSCWAGAAGTGCGTDT